jgi:hypothetical protein
LSAWNEPTIWFFSGVEPLGREPMPHYYLDLRDEDDLAVDEEGLELRDVAAVQEEATQSLAEMAGDAVRGPSYDGNRNHQMAIEVRDETGPVLQVKFTFQINRQK